jgi:hypothetical protein
VCRSGPAEVTGRAIADVGFGEEEFPGYRQHPLVARRDADSTVFTHDEFDTIDRVPPDPDGLDARQVTD